MIRALAKQDLWQGGGGSFALRRENTGTKKPGWNRVELKIGTQANSNMKNSMVVSIFFCFWPRESFFKIFFRLEVPFLG